MSSNNDNTTARFLYAILEQKSLKDIDWNAVANNKCLTQTISNGHAARMRYSRFKNNLLKTEPQRRNRTAANKSKVTKSKKETKTKTRTKKEKEEDEQPVKPDPNAAPDAHREDTKTLSPQVKNEAIIKREHQQSSPDAQTEMTPVSMPEAQMQFHYNRLLTPGSDIDIFATPHAYAAASPANELLHTHHEPSPFHYTGIPHCHPAPEQVVSSWPQTPSYSPFPLQTYEMDGFGAAPFSDNQHTVAHPEGFGIAPSEMMGPDHSHGLVKQEEWDARF